jgi:acyl-CoA synthetase (AMP-forming)/AMP-acid ligase II
VAAFGKNSDAYLLLYLGCARAGLVHVPVNFNARGDELAYLLTQSEPTAAFVDAALTAHVEAKPRRADRPQPLRASSGGARGHPHRPDNTR